MAATYYAKPIDGRPDYTPASLLSGFYVSRMLDVGHPDYKDGDLFRRTTRWEEYSLIVRLENLIKIHHTNVPLSYFAEILEILGMPSLSAHVGFSKEFNLKKGEKMFILDASGAVGQLVGQFTKLSGS
nr:NADP-dependent alkenal double bond reductase P2-like [Ziziphus jujuba var. spinosa]